MNLSADRLISVSAEAATSLISWSWQAAILLACVWLGLKILRIKSPALRHQLWLFGLITVVVIPLLGVILKSLPLPQPANRTISYAVDLPRIIVTNEAAPVMGDRLPAVVARPASNHPLILGTLFLVWLAGLCIMLARAISHGKRLYRLRVRARLIPLPDLGFAEHESLTYGRVCIVLSENVSSPVLLGLFRPMIVLPADIINWTSPGERRAILQHELAHVVRRDQYIHLFQIVIGMIFYFHPMVRYTCRQLSIERELACDDRVVIHGTAAETYAESIVKVAERNISMAGTPSGAHQLAIFNSRQILERRIEMILNKDRVRVIANHWRYLVPAAALMGALVWMLIPKQPTTAHQLEKQLDDVSAAVKGGSLRELLGKYMADSNAYNEMVSTVLTGPDANLREEALRSLVKSEGEWATVALVEIYDKSRDLSLRRILIDYLGQRKALAKLMELAVEEPNEQLRQLAAQRLIEMEGDDVADTLVDLYGRTRDQELRENVIRSFGRRGDIDRLAMVGDMEKDMENNQELIRLNLEQLEWMAANHESTDTRRKAHEWLAMRRRQTSGKDRYGIDYPPPTPPPPPPAPSPSLRILNDSGEAARMLREDPNENTIVIALLRECLDAQIRQDTAFLERLLAEDFQGIGPDGVAYKDRKSVV